MYFTPLFTLPFSIVDTIKDATRAMVERAIIEKILKSPGDILAEDIFEKDSPDGR